MSLETSSYLPLLIGAVALIAFVLLAGRLGMSVGEAMSTGMSSVAHAPQTQTDGCPDLDRDGYHASWCGGDDCDDLDPTLTPIDADGDGFSTCRGDCLDRSRDARPGLTEWCDGLDNDCDGQRDEGC